MQLEKCISGSRIFDTVVKSEVLKSFGKKRKYEEIPPEVDKENYSTYIQMDVDSNNDIAGKNSKKQDSSQNFKNLYKTFKTSSKSIHPTTFSEAKNFPSLI